MIPTKAYILKIDTPLSTAYAKVCSDSCNKVGMPWTYYDGFQNQSGKMALMIDRNTQPIKGPDPSNLNNMGWIAQPICESSCIYDMSCMYNQHNIAVIYSLFSFQSVWTALGYCK